jgi:hypothetical protein
MLGGCDRTLRVLIVVHRGCISELCGVRQRRAAAHELELDKDMLRHKDRIIELY